MRWPMRWHLKRRLERRGRVAPEGVQIMRDRALVQRRVLWNDGAARCGEHLHARQVISGEQRTCGMMVIAFRSAARPSELTSRPSMTIEPPHGSTSRKRARIREDLPEEEHSSVTISGTHPSISRKRARMREDLPEEEHSSVTISGNHQR